MLLHGGLKSGYWGCRYHMLGISFGVGIMLWLSYWGMSALIVEMPQLMFVVRVLGTAYLLWLTYTLATSDLTSTIENALQGKKLSVSMPAASSQKKPFVALPLTFRQATLFQWLNPKAWTMTMVAPSLVVMTSTRPWLDNWPFLVMCMAINLICIGFWSAGGQSLRKLSHHPKLMQVVHLVIVLMTLYCAIAMWL